MTAKVSPGELELWRIGAFALSHPHSILPRDQDLAKHVASCAGCEARVKQRRDLDRYSNGNDVPDVPEFESWPG